MGLFEKKIKRTLDDELEPPAPAPVPVPAPVVTPAATVPSRGPVKADHPDYGINKAIELMRMLPDDNIELVVRVVKTTLESTDIDVGNIINDATRKQGQIEARVDVLKKQIAQLESEIATFRGEITTLEADHKETSTVKDRLVLAEKLTSTASRVAKPTAPPASPPTRPTATSSDPTR